jgi:GT2 family glycosyltransferase
MNSIRESVRHIARQTRAFVLTKGLDRNAEFLQPEAEINASSDISIVIPILDPPPLRRCLASIERFAPKSEVILIDDGSSMNQTQEIIKEFVSRNGWKVIRNERSRGHSRATEAGALLATRPYLCLLNSDTIVTPWSWLGAKEAFESDPNIAAAGPSTSQATTPQKLRRAEVCRHHWTDPQIFAFAQRYVSGYSACSPVDLPVVGGFALFIRRCVWEQLEGFDPELPDYGNEKELCIRIVKSGWRIVWTRSSYIHHLGSQTYSGPQFGWDFIHSKARLADEYIIKKHGSLHGA